ncbi:MAG: hypothetical protein ROZ37_18645 [Aromatoleum sp.]|jgi:hypothetical protein|uniref:hypothetical protein n=1 Tax=Aromatoleum sp. TaxID=2307007 RepID=UPI0028953832|nr:hypothetical protein [Aromatoleum sp.]MDT3672344.1 hypothetical protein [Aromatoleum sp.]
MFRSADGSGRPAGFTGWKLDALTAARVIHAAAAAGRLTTINTASRADVKALTCLLQQLEADMSRSS